MIMSTGWILNLLAREVLGLTLIMTWSAGRLPVPSTGRWSGDCSDNETVLKQYFWYQCPDEMDLTW
jgi:hypothetical protein